MILERCALICTLPSDRTAVERMFASPAPGSFGEEWIRSQPSHTGHAGCVESYLDFFLPVWSEAVRALAGLEIAMISNASSDNFAESFGVFDVIGVLAHHVEDPPRGQLPGIECIDKTITLPELAAIAPVGPAVVHLGVCRSVGFSGALKARCGSVIVISSQAQVEPEFFLRTFTKTAELWRTVRCNYVEAHTSVRFAMLNALGA